MTKRHRSAIDSYCPEDVGTMVVRGKGGSAIVPNQFDQPFILEQLEKIKNSPSLISNYKRQLQTRFSLESQRRVIDKMVQYNQTISQGIRSQTEITRSRKELLEAERELLIAEENHAEVSDEIEIKKLDREIRKLDRQEQVAQKKQSIKSIEEGKTEPTESEKYRERKEEGYQKSVIDGEYRSKRKLDNIRQDLQHKDDLFKEFEAQKERIIKDVVGDKPYLKWTSEERERIDERIRNVEIKFQDILDLDDDELEE